jgi:hypothetical protein
MTGTVGSAVTGGAGLSGMTSLGTVTTGTLGSGVLFPSIHPTVKIVEVDWAGDQTGTTETVVADYYNWQNTISNSTVWVEISFHAIMGNNGSAGTSRYAYFKMYWHTALVADGATSGFGTKLDTAYLGRVTATSSASSNNSYLTGVLHSKFTSNATIGTSHYIGVTSDNDGNTARARFWGGDSYQTQIKTIEY